MTFLKIFEQNLHTYHRNDFTSVCIVHFNDLVILIYREIMSIRQVQDFVNPLESREIDISPFHFVRLTQTPSLEVVSLV